MSNNTPSTKVLPGFMELLPADQLLFNSIKETIRETYESFGFSPIDTPLIERAEVLLSKSGGETEKQVYRFLKGKNDLALRFDLTIPLARYVSEHFHELAFPFRRYHIGKVYRGERPQRGRYREFYQCDIDIIGKESLDLMNDAEIPSVIYAVFSKLNFGKFLIKINNRKIISGLMEELGIKELSVDVLRIIDKLEKIGEEAVCEMLQEIGITEEQSEKIFAFLGLSGTSTEIIEQLRTLGVTAKQFALGVNELECVVANLALLGVPEEAFMIDLTIARGLDYYTGTVYETTLVDHPEIGSICSGGRYDNLAKKFTDKKLPGVGISIGLTRLFWQLTEVGIIKNSATANTNVLVIPLTEDLSTAISIAKTLREQSIATELYAEKAKMKTKLSYANKRGVPYVILVGEEEINTGRYGLKNMETGEQVECTIDELAENLRA